MATTSHNLAKEINRQLAEYANGVGEKVEIAAKQRTKEGAKRLKANSPVLTGDYRKGWRAKKVDGKWVVYNATDYQLTHLLEKGNAKVGGGRVPAQVHIAPVEEVMMDGFIADVEKAVRGE